MNRATPQPSVTATFAVECAESARLAQLLLEFVGDHMNVDRERVHWGHAGDAAHLRQQLRELVHHFGLDR